MAANACIRFAEGVHLLVALVSQCDAIFNNVLSQIIDA
jgi:hypothetical protein